MKEIMQHLNICSQHKGLSKIQDTKLQLQHWSCDRNNSITVRFLRNCCFPPFAITETTNLFHK